MSEDLGPLAEYIEQAIEANEAPKHPAENAEEPAGLTGDRTQGRGAAGAATDPLEGLKRIIGMSRDDTGAMLDPNFSEDD